MVRIEVLNSFRGIAAAIVALDHFTLLSGYAPPGSWPFYVATFAGSFGVGLFFLISGFVIPLSLWNSGTTEFLIRRSFRLLPVFAFCCALRWLFLIIAGAANFDLHYFGVYVLNISMFGTTFFPLEKLIEPIVWTLAIEVKFYIICAVLFHFFRTDPRKLFQASIIFLSVAAILSHYLPWREIPWRMDVDIGLSVVPFMFNGLFFSLLYFNKIGRAEALVGVFCASAAFLVGPCDWFVAIDKGLPSWMLAAAVFVVALRKHDGLPILTTPIARFFGDISYPLYAVHVAIASAALAYAPYGMAGKFVAFVISAVAAAWLIHVSIEQPSIRLSKRTFGKMSNKRVTA